MRLGGENTVFDGIGFNLGAYAEVLATGETVDLAFVPDINEYRGRRSLQLNVKDLGAPAVLQRLKIALYPHWNRTGTGMTYLYPSLFLPLYGDWTRGK